MILVIFIQWHCWWKKSCTTWHVWNPVNNGIFTISTGQDFWTINSSKDSNPNQSSFLPLDYYCFRCFHTHAGLPFVSWLGKLKFLEIRSKFMIKKKHRHHNRYEHVSIYLYLHIYIYTCTVFLYIHTTVHTHIFFSVNLPHALYLFHHFG